jgi:hypothetical protein
MIYSLDDTPVFPGKIVGNGEVVSQIQHLIENDCEALK